MKRPQQLNPVQMAVEAVLLLACDQPVRTTIMEKALGDLPQELTGVEEACGDAGGDSPCRRAFYEPLVHIVILAGRKEGGGSRWNGPKVRLGL